MALEYGLQKETRGFVRFAHHRPWPTLGIMLGGCVLALAYNVVLMQSVRSISSVGTAVLGNFRTVLLLFLSACFLGELSDWGATRYIGCFNAFAGAAAYGLHAWVFGTPVWRTLPRSLAAEVDSVREEEGEASYDERERIATPATEEDAEC